MQESVNIFKNSMMKKLLELENEITYFQGKLFKTVKLEQQFP